MNMTTLLHFEHFSLTSNDIQLQKNNVLRMYYCTLLSTWDLKMSNQFQQPIFTIHGKYFAEKRKTQKQDQQPTYIY